MILNEDTFSRGSDILNQYKRVKKKTNYNSISLNIIKSQIDFKKSKEFVKCRLECV